MKFSTTTTAAVLALSLPTTLNGFTVPVRTANVHRASAGPVAQQQLPSSQVLRVPTVVFSEAEDRDNEIERLKSMAAKLRSEAATLEAEQRSAMAEAAERAFRKFDTNNDGQISLEELKIGLEKEFKTELPDKRVVELMNTFDASGDGALQPDEFVTVDQFRNKLDALVREEKALAREEAKKAETEKEAMQLIEAQLELINDRAPTTQEKIFSILPYLFPLLDGLQFARFIVNDNPDNLISQIILLAYVLYRSVPFGGFIAFFALNFLSGNPTINRLIRFNMQQAIFLDIALFIPGLFGALAGIVGSSAGVGIPPGLAALGSDALFAILILSVTYSSVSSLLGITPNKLPIISEAVERRMPTFEVLDGEGRFLSQQEREEIQNGKKKDDEEK